ncbi:hypothetical protein ACWDUN_02325 [Mycobacterium sp. NPDC003323]
MPSSIGDLPTTEDIASASDAAPVSVITEDPSCAPSRAIFDAISATQKKGWNTSDFTKPTSSWTDSERNQYNEVADAMRSAADQTVELAKLTPHRAMRELYLQTIAYWRAYADSISDYKPADHELAKTAGAISSAIVWICSAINNQSAATWGALVESAPEPISPNSDINIANPRIFMDSSPNDQCPTFKEAIERFETAAAPWYALDANLPATQWTPEQQASMKQTSAEMEILAQELEQIGQASGDTIFNDFSSLAAQYWRAFGRALPTYTTADSYLSSAASSIGFAIFDGCTFASSS